jgi:hypothetical protein
VAPDHLSKRILFLPHQPYRWAHSVSLCVNSGSIHNQYTLLATSKNLAVLCHSNVKSWFSRILVEMTRFYAHNSSAL